ncbi:MAG: site-specific integrase, partial [Candidatus Hydrogenedentes bacterium]|nr:site-specific integrase [Candidatus Hydrogenedentota bacterium]
MPICSARQASSTTTPGKAFISIAYGSGLRSTEIVHLTWRDIDFDQGLISVSAKKMTKDVLEWEPKGRRNRTVPMPKETSRFLAKLHSGRAKEHPYVFITSDRYRHVRKRQKCGTWKVQSTTINNLGRNFEVIQKRAKIS